MEIGFIYQKVIDVNTVKGFFLIFLVLGISLPLTDTVSDDTPSSKNRVKEEISLVDVKDIAAYRIQVGEKLTYNIKLGLAPLGKRVDHIIEKTPYNGQHVYKIQSEAKTGALGKIYPFQNRQFTYLNVDGLHPVSFRNQLRDRKYRAVVEINFRDGEAEYKKISQENSKAPQKNDNKSLTIPLGTQDELSMIYLLRRKKIEPGKTYFFPLISKGKVLKVRIKVDRGKILKIKRLGAVRTLVVQTSEGSRLWLTDDSRHLPVRIEAEMKIGKMKANLEKIEFIR